MRKKWRRKVARLVDEKQREAQYRYDDGLLKVLQGRTDAAQVRAVCV